MAINGLGISHNGKIHPARVGPSLTEAGAVDLPSTRSRGAGSVRSKLAKRVRALAHRKRMSESAIIDCALWHFFRTGQAANVTDLMSKAGIVPRRRRT